MTQNYHISLRILFFLAAIIVLGYVLLHLSLFFLFLVLLQYQLSYVYIIPIFVPFLGTLILLAINLLWVTDKTTKYSRQCIKYTAYSTVITLIGVFIYAEVPSFYDEYVGKVPSEVSLTAYTPFTANTKAISIDEVALLKLTDELPRLDGATALYPLYASFVQAVYPNKEPYNSDCYDNIEVSCSKTNSAYQRLFNNQTDIIFVAGPSEMQIEQAESLGLTMELTPIGSEAFVFFTNSSNPTENLTIEQIQGIYSGQYTRWEQISKGSGEIIAFQRPKNSGSQTALEKIMDGKNLIEPIKENSIGGMGDIIEYTSDYTNYRKAIGYSYLFFTQNMMLESKINLLKINGIEPTKENIKNKTYPFTANFYAITIKEHKNNENIDKLIEWILSEQGQKIVEEVGFVPL